MCFVLQLRCNCPIRYAYWSSVADWHERLLQLMECVGTLAGVGEHVLPPCAPPPHDLAELAASDGVVVVRKQASLFQCDSHRSSVLATLAADGLNADQRSAQVTGEEEQVHVLEVLHVPKGRLHL